MKLLSAQPIANEIIQALRPQCSEIHAAGSVRRRASNVKDVEIVYISHTSSQQMPLFNSVTQPTAHTPAQTYFHANNAIAKLIDEGVLVKDTVVKRWGSKYKRCIHCASGIVIELFRATVRNWGYIFALRTGPEDFNKILVTSRSQGGALPPHITLQGGYVWNTEGLTLIPTPTEQAFFAILDLPVIPPHERTVERLKHCIQERQNR